MSSIPPPPPAQDGAAPSVAPNETVWVAPPPPPILRGEATPIGRGPFAIVEALLKSPASVLYDVQHRRGALLSLSALVIVTMILTGLVMAAFSGGLQLLF